MAAKRSHNELEPSHPQINKRPKPTRAVPNHFDLDDPFSWYEFMMKWGGHVFDDLTTILPTILNDCQRVFAWIEMAGHRFEIRKHCFQNPSLMVFNNQYKSSFALSYHHRRNSETKTIIKQIPLWKLVQTNWEHLPRFDSIISQPPFSVNIQDSDPDTKEHRRPFNRWPGFRATIFPTAQSLDMKLVQPVLDHIRTILTNRDETLYRYFISWLSHIVQHPWQRTNVPIIFIQHCNDGRDHFFIWFNHNVMGTRLGTHFMNGDQLTQHRNRQPIYKIYVHGSNALPKRWSTILNRATQPYIIEKQMNHPHIPIHNTMNFIGELDRDEYLRHMKKHCNDGKGIVFIPSAPLPTANSPYYDHLDNVMPDNDTITSNHFLTYLHRLTSNDTVPLHPLPIQPPLH